jgi:opacity protein-like surface antigen
MKKSTSGPWVSFSLIFLPVFLLVCATGVVFAQSSRTTWTNKYDLGVFGEYSPTSSHILLGYARQRKLAGIGGSLAWRLINRHSFELAYLVEVRPLLMESDPTLVSITGAQLGTIPFVPPLVVVDPVNSVLITVIQPNGNTQTYSGTANYSRRWTYSGGASPIGLKLNGLTHRRIQPEVMSNVGFLIASRDIPVPDSSSFNFTFEFGAGVQWYRTPSQSIQAEVRYHHLSNRNLGTENPGVDSALWKVTYSFGRKHLRR